MAITTNPSSNDPQIVGNAFVNQYYYILHHYPEEACKFYQDASVLSRPGPDRVMTLVTTMKAINDQILSSDHQNYKAKIYSADSQLFSPNNGVIVLVNGCLTGNGNVSRKFSQVFFLVPQNGGSSYYVLNDVFRYVDDVVVDERVVTTPPLTTQKPDHTTDTNDDKEVTKATSSKIQEGNDDKEVTKTASSKIQEGDDNKEVTKTTSSKIQESNDAKEVTKTISSKMQEGNDAKEVTKTASTKIQEGNDAKEVTKTAASSKMQEDSPKKTYASIVHALKENTAPLVRRVPPPKPKFVEQPGEATAAPKTASAPSSAASSTVKGHSIFVANLRVDATVELLVGIFKQFGAIKPNGVHVRSRKIEGKCFGFVEFEHASSVQGALEASPIIIGNQKAYVERKRANNDSGRFPTVHSRRNEFEKQAEGQVRGNAGPNGKGKGRAAGQGQGGRK